MARYIGPKTRLSRKFHEDLGLKTNAAKTMRRLMSAPGVHGAKMRRKPTQYGIQLKEKQKIKAIYGLTEKQLVKIYKKAAESKLATGDMMLVALESRFDNVIYRLGWAKTRAAARQLVNHGHFLVNGDRLNIPSYQVQVGDVISVRSKSTRVNVLSDLVKEPATVAPVWLTVKGAGAKIEALPEREQIAEKINEQLVVEFYSR